MRRPVLFAVVFSLALFGAFNARAQDDPLVDRVAADFFENGLRRSQSRNIEAATAEIYRALDADAQAAFRDERRGRWRDMGTEARRALRGVQAPEYDNLTEEQKTPFRRAAADRLSGARGGGDEI